MSLADPIELATYWLAQGNRRNAVEELIALTWRIDNHQEPHERLNHARYDADRLVTMRETYHGEAS